MTSRSRRLQAASRHWRVSVRRANALPKPWRLKSRRKPRLNLKPEPAPAAAAQPAPEPASVAAPPTAAAFRAAAQGHALAALNSLAALATGANSEAVRVSAANAVLDRAHGRPAPGRPLAEEDDAGQVRWEVQWVDAAKP
jgi:hypothetical protein